MVSPHWGQWGGKVLIDIHCSTRLVWLVLWKPMAVWELKQGSQIQFLPQNPLECPSQGVSNHRQHNIKAPHYWPFVTGMRFNVMATSWSAIVFPAGMIGYWSFPRVINTMAINPGGEYITDQPPTQWGERGVSKRGYSHGSSPRKGTGSLWVWVRPMREGVTL